MAKTHYATVQRGNESQMYDEWDDTTVCGIEYFEGDVTDNWEHVTCKRCLNKNKSKQLTPPTAAKTK